MVICALCAGLISGALLTLLQLFTTMPLIAQAEIYESAAAPSPELDHHAPHDHGWSPETGLERILYTAIATVLMAIGYGLLLAAALSRLKAPDWRQGLILGLAGFVVFQLAPALGLPPQLPGMPEVALGGRQLWWFATVVATALGLAAFCRARNRSSALWVVLGMALLVAPHLMGAPQAPAQASGLPLALTREFAAAAMLTAALFWLVLGALEGLIYARLLRR